MKESFHPLTGQVLTAKVALIPVLISFGNFAISKLDIPSKVSQPAETTMQVLIVLLVEGLIYLCTKLLNEKHRKKEITGLERRKSELETLIPNITDLSTQKIAQKSIKEINEKLISLISR